MTRRRLRILLTEGSSISARHTLYALGPDHEIEVADAGFWRLGRASRYVKRWHRVPAYQTQPDAFVENVLTLLRQRVFDVLLPTHEEIYVISRFQNQIAALTGLACPPFAALEQLQSKARFSELLRELDLPQPKTEIVRSRAEIASIKMFPCFLKLAFSTASQGVRRVANSECLPAILDELEAGRWFDGQQEILVQQAVDGVESAAIGMFQHGRMLAFHGFEEWAKGSMGMPIARRSVVHANVVEHTRQIGERLGWHGPFCLAYFYDQQRRLPSYIECNPRIGETMNGVLAGVNVCDAWTHIAMGETFEPLALPKVAVQTYCGFLVLLAHALDHANRRTLVRLLWQRWRRLGYYANAENELTRPREDWLSVIPAVLVVGLLLLYPPAGRWLVRRTVSRYALSDEAARGIRQLDF